MFTANPKEVQKIRLDHIASLIDLYGKDSKEVAKAEEDFLDEIIDEATKRDPEFPALLEAAGAKLDNRKA
jgi:hypothetical protein